MRLLRLRKGRITIGDERLAFCEQVAPEEDLGAAVFPLGEDLGVFGRVKPRRRQRCRRIGAVAVELHDDQPLDLPDPLEFRAFRAGAENGAGAGSAHQVGDLRAGQFLIDGNGDARAVYDGQVGRDPFVAALTHDSDPLAL